MKGRKKVGFPKILTKAMALATGIGSLMETSSDGQVENNNFQAKWNI